jgi:hypothetical protein
VGDLLLPEPPRRLVVVAQLGVYGGALLGAIPPAFLVKLRTADALPPLGSPWSWQQRCSLDTLAIVAASLIRGRLCSSRSIRLDRLRWSGSMALVASTCSCTTWCRASSFRSGGLFGARPALHQKSLPNRSCTELYIPCLVLVQIGVSEPKTRSRSLPPKAILHQKPSPSGRPS